MFCVILVTFVHLVSRSRTSLPLLTMSLRHSCLLLLFSSLSPSPPFSSLLSCYLCHPCFTFYPRHLCSPCTPSSYLLTIVTSVGIACDRGHRHAAPCHVAQNIQRMCPLTTFLARTDSSIACDCIYLDAAPCHDACDAHVGHAAVSDSDSHDKDY